MSNVSTWSATAASNNSATPDGWPENMPPSGVNDSARENMAAMARLFKDQNGTLETAGTGAAYTLTTNNANATLAAQSLLVFNIHTINTGAATLNADSLGAKSLKINGAALTAGDLIADVTVLAIYNATTDVYDVVAGQDGKFGTLTLGSGSITDSSGAISFGNENLSSTGTLGIGAITTSSVLTTVGSFSSVTSGQGRHYSDATNGFVVQGFGSAFDWRLLNRTGSSVLANTANTTNLVATGDLSVAGDVTLSAGDLNIAAPTVPASASATGTTGDIAWASGFVYVCVATNTWQRAAIATW